MKFSSVCQLALASSAIAAPAAKGPNAADTALLKARASGLTDPDILNFALTLEHLEYAFYTSSLKMLSASDFMAAGYDPVVRTNIEEIAADEGEHVKFLTAALKAGNYPAVPACKYAFGVSDVKTFMETAGILEGVGITAYLGAASLIMNPGYLTAAGSILTIEARHSSYIRANQMPGQSPFPYAFDVPQDPTAVYSLASQFITSCPSSANLGITPFPLLTYTKAQPPPVHQGKQVLLNIDSTAKAVDGTTNAFWATNLGFVYAASKIIKKGSQIIVDVPNTLAGQSYVTIANATKAKDVSDSNIVAGPAIVMVQSPYTIQKGM